MMHLGGAPARVAPTLNAVAFRSAQYVLNITAAWEASHEDQQHIGWAREFWGAAHPLSTGIGYTNFMTEDEGDARVLQFLLCSTLTIPHHTVLAEACCTANFDPAHVGLGSNASFDRSPAA